MCSEIGNHLGCVCAPGFAQPSLATSLSPARVRVNRTTPPCLAQWLVLAWSSSARVCVAASSRANRPYPTRQPPSPCVGAELERPRASRGARLPRYDPPRRIPKARRRGSIWPPGARLDRGSRSQTQRPAPWERSRAAGPGAQTRPLFIPSHCPADPLATCDALFKRPTLTRIIVFFKYDIFDPFNLDGDGPWKCELCSGCWRWKQMLRRGCQNWLMHLGDNVPG
jgi:hypothetical protein